VERSAVVVASWAMALFGGVYLALAPSQGSWHFWLLAAEMLGLAGLGFAQERTGHIDMAVLLLSVAAAAASSIHLAGEPHRTAIGMVVATAAGLVYVLEPPRRRPPILAALVGLWALQSVFPSGRSLLLLYQAALFGCLVLVMARVGDSVDANRIRFRQLFEQAPVPLWEEDFSRVQQWLQELRTSGVEDLRSYFERRPDDLDRALALIEVLDVNTAAADLIEVEDVTGMLGAIDPTTFTPETRPAFLDQLVAVWNGDSEMTTDLVGSTVTGRRIEAIMRWSAPLTPAGVPDYQRVVVSIDDVSELMEVQRDLAEANSVLAEREEQLRTVVSGAPVILFAMDREGKLTLSEGSGLDLLGETAEDLVGTSVFDRYAERPDVLAHMRRVLCGEPVQFLLERNGLVWEMRLSPHFDESGAPAGAVGVATDMTDRHRMEAALEEVRRRHRLMIRHVTDLLYTLDEHGTVGFVSPSVEATLGYRPEHVVGTSMVDLVHPEDLPTVVEVAGGTPPGASTPPIQHRVRRADGTWIYMEARAANLLEDPELSSWVVTARDITDRVQAQEDLQEAFEAAEAATRAKSELLANVSHEIRTPMSAILGMTDLALETDLDEEQREFLTTVRSSAESLLTIINDLLDLSRVEAGRLTIEQVPFSVRGTLEDVIRTVRVRAAEKGLDLRVEVGDGVPEWVIGDPGRLRQVVMNLVGNAVKFTDDGTVTVRARTGQGDLLEFEVADTGIGIDPTHLDSIFDAFEQADGSPARRHGGTGLGLAISSNLVALMGGTIGVRSQVGSGSVFHFTVRLPPTESSTSSAEPAMRAGSVLVISGRRQLRRLVDGVADAGYSALGIETTAEALTLAAALLAEGRRIGAVVADFAEPDVEHCRRLTESDLLRGVPVLAVVGSGRRGDGVRFREAGVRAYLARPLDEEDLREALAAISSGTAGRDDLVTRHWLRDRRRSLTVLLADDSATNRVLAARVLEKRGHRVVQAADGEEVLELMAAGRFDAVLMDVQMPIMDGLEATRRIREAGEDVADLPIVALTAHASESDRGECLAAGMDGYLPKPFNPDELIAVVEGLAAERRAAGRAPALWPELVESIEHAADLGDRTRLTDASRRLSETLEVRGDSRAAAAARRLEEASAGNGDFSDHIDHLLEVLGVRQSEPAG
jgi:PAS domain S-box-containing protein